MDVDISRSVLVHMIRQVALNIVYALGGLFTVNRGNCRVRAFFGWRCIAA